MGVNSVPLDCCRAMIGCNILGTKLRPHQIYIAFSSISIHLLDLPKQIWKAKFLQGIVEPVWHYIIMDFITANQVKGKQSAKLTVQESLLKTVRFLFGPIDGCQPPTSNHGPAL